MELLENNEIEFIPTANTEYGIELAKGELKDRGLVFSDNFFDEDVEAADWNYDDYFAEKVKQAINEITNPLGAWKEK